jgi:hypothetical protein
MTDQLYLTKEHAKYLSLLKIRGYFGTKQVECAQQHELQFCSGGRQQSQQPPGRTDGKTPCGRRSSLLPRKKIKNVAITTAGFKYRNNWFSDDQIKHTQPHSTDFSGSYRESASSKLI